MGSGFRSYRDYQIFGQPLLGLEGQGATLGVIRRYAIQVWGSILLRSPSRFGQATGRHRRTEFEDRYQIGL